MQSKNQRLWMAYIRKHISSCCWQNMTSDNQTPSLVPGHTESYRYFLNSKSLYILYSWFKPFIPQFQRFIPYTGTMKDIVDQIWTSDGVQRNPNENLITAWTKSNSVCFCPTIATCIVRLGTIFGQLRCTGNSCNNKMKGSTLLHFWTRQTPTQRNCICLVPIVTRKKKETKAFQCIVTNFFRDNFILLPTQSRPRIFGAPLLVSFE